MRILAAVALALLGACGHDSGVDCAAVTCGPIAPAILLTVTDARGSPLMAMPTITNVVVAATATRSQTSCTFSNPTMERGRLCRRRRRCGPLRVRRRRHGLQDATPRSDRAAGIDRRLLSHASRIGLSRSRARSVTASE